MSSQNSGNNNTTVNTWLGWPQHCVVYTCVLTFSSFIFIASMILTVYMTHTNSIDKALVVLIVGCCLLYLFGFCGNMYSIYFGKPTSTPSENGGNSNRSSQITAGSAQSISMNPRPPDIVRFPRARDHFRKTPPPPYENQMSETSCMLQPGTSRTESSEREAEIVTEARKLVQKLYEEIKMTDQFAQQSFIHEQSERQMVQTPQTRARHQETTLPKVLDQNLVVQYQQSGLEGSSGVLPPDGFYTNQQKVARSLFTNHFDLERSVINSEEIKMTDQLAQRSFNDEPSMQQMVQTPKTQARHQEMTSPKLLYQDLMIQKQQIGLKSSSGVLPSDVFNTHQINQKVAPSSIPNQLDLERLIINSEGCNVVPLQSSPRIPGRPSMNIRMNQIVQQKSLSTQPDLQKFVIGSDGQVAVPGREDILKSVRKRKTTSPLQELQTRPKTTVNTPIMKSVDGDSQNNEYEEIEVLRGSLSTSSSQVGYESVEHCYAESELEDTSERASTVASAVSEPGPTERKSFRIRSVKERRQLSLLSTRKFYQLGQSPQTVLNAIATCFDLTPDEWMVAWKLSLKGVHPSERARILGVRLQEDSYNNED